VNGQVTGAADPWVRLGFLGFSRVIFSGHSFVFSNFLGSFGKIHFFEFGTAQELFRGSKGRNSRTQRPYSHLCIEMADLFLGFIRRRRGTSVHG